MLELILIRHGQTDSNMKRTYLGWTDVELNSEGLRQASIVRDKLKGIKADAIYSSPLKRANKTAAIINETLNLEVIYFESLKERNFGTWDNMTIDEIIKNYPKEYTQWEQDWINYHINKGESALESYLRTIEFIDKNVLSKNKGTYIVVAHGGNIRFIIAYLLGMKIEDSWRFKINNCSITRIEIDNFYGVLTQLNNIEEITLE